MTGHDPQPWRAHFPILRDTTYLVNHSLGAMPIGVRARLAEFADAWATRGVRAWGEGWWRVPATVGDLLARLMNAPAGSVSMHTNVAQVQAIVASALDFDSERDGVVYTDQNFPSNMYLWEAHRRYGARPVVVASEGEGLVPREALLAAIDERTRLVAISHVCFRNSFVQDAAAVCARAREVGALVLLDTYQSLGTLPLDVRALGVDMVCGGSVKWLCGGPGAAYLYVRPELLPELLPAATGWAAHAEPFAFERGAQRYADDALRLTQGTPAVATLVAAQAGYELLLDVGVDAVRAWSVALNERLAARLAERGFELYGPRAPEQRGGTLTVALRADESGPAYVRALAERGVLIDHRPDAGLRVSPHFYTRMDELDAFAEHLTELRASGAWRAHTGPSEGY
jgi:kynureninase